MRRTGPVGVVSIVLLLTAVVASPGYADRARAVDGNDAQGPLDIEYISHGHRTTTAGVRQLVHTVRLFERWPARRLGRRAFVRLFFDLPGNDNSREERAVYIVYEFGGLSANLYNYAADPPSFMRQVPLRRPDGRTLKVLLKKRWLRAGLDRYEWHALSHIDEGAPGCGVSGGCNDIAPNGRHLQHDV